MLRLWNPSLRSFKPSCLARHLLIFDFAVDVSLNNSATGNSRFPACPPSAEPLPGVRIPTNYSKWSVHYPTREEDSPTSRLAFRLGARRPPLAVLLAQLRRKTSLRSSNPSREQSSLLAPLLGVFIFDILRKLLGEGGISAFLVASIATRRSVRGSAESCARSLSSALASFALSSAKTHGSLLPVRIPLHLTKNELCRPRTRGHHSSFGVSRSRTAPSLVL
jgi:hypothetical protein